ncbi:flavin reductase family protein [Roseibium sediminicola]|uniref:flavin reductase family protein n=1 Tax=Roseibium sediminicola TaxID=2933272 RepID=UPI0031F2FA2F
MGRFATGVAVILTEEHGRPAGMTVNSLTSVSLDPILLLFCARNESRVAQSVLSTGRFSVNILARDQTDISNAFAGCGDPDLVPLIRERGFLRLAAPTAAFLCEVAQVYPGGDHQIILGRPLHMSAPSDGDRPLVFYQGKYTALPDTARC